MSEFFLKMKDVAKRLGISQATVRRLVKSQGIPFHLIGHSYRFTMDDLNTYLSKTAIPMREKNDNT